MCRCALRSRRQPILPPLRIDIRVAEAIHEERNVGGLQWQGRECENTTTEVENGVKADKDRPCHHSPYWSPSEEQRWAYHSYTSA